MTSRSATQCKRPKAVKLAAAAPPGPDSVLNLEIEPRPGPSSVSESAAASVPVPQVPGPAPGRVGRGAMTRHAGAEELGLRVLGRRPRLGVTVRWRPRDADSEVLPRGLRGSDRVVTRTGSESATSHVRRAPPAARASAAQ